MRDLVRNNKGPAALISVALVALLAWLAFGFFGIHTAFIDDVVDEDGPVFDVLASSSAEPAVAETAPLAVPPPESAAAEEPVATASAAEEPATEPAVEEPAAEEPVAAEAPPAEERATEEPANTEAPAADEPVSAEAPAAEEPVAEAPPAPEPTPTPEPEPTPEPQQATPGEVVTLFRGSFSGLNDYAVAGNVSVLSNGTEQRFLRFENFASDNGPDLKVYLRAASGEFISLGNLSGNIGNQNYEIPVGVDLNVFSTVEIWCERFSSGFGAAALGAA